MRGTKGFKIVHKTNLDLDHGPQLLEFLLVESGRRDPGDASVQLLHRVSHHADPNHVASD